MGDHDDITDEWKNWRGAFVVYAMPVTNRCVHKLTYVPCFIGCDGERVSCH